MQHPTQAPSSHNSILLALAVIGAGSLLGVVGLVAYSAGRAQTATATTPEAVRTSVSAVTPATPPTSAAPSTPPTTPVALPAPAAPDDERVMTSTAHGAAYASPLLFHYAHVGGRGLADVHGQLDHRDGHYFQLGPGDSLTLEAPDGYEFFSDGTDAAFDLELEIHPHAEASQNYEVDVSHAHLDVNGPWVVLGHGEAHEWDLDHVNVREARYVRVRNVDPRLTLYIDGVYVRSMRACVVPSRCRDVNHLIPRR